MPRSIPAVAGAAVLAALLARPVGAESPSMEERFRRLEARQEEMERELREKDRRIEELERQLGTRAEKPAPKKKPTRRVAAPEPKEAPAKAAVVTAPDLPAPEPTARADWGLYEPGKGFVVGRTPHGELDISAWGYIRYLNQKQLRDFHTDAFGRTREIQQRDDVHMQKVTVYFKGWIYDPKLRYTLYVWTSNTSLGQGAQVVVAGYLGYDFLPEFGLYGGIGGLPTTRTTQGIWPFMLKVDHRTIADEFFRGSYTNGVWGEGKLLDGALKYKLMVGNNLSQLGVDAGQLDSSFNTWSGALWWMPTTGEFGPREGYGDFEHHDRLATMLGLRFTRSREDKQSQPAEDDPENTQIRLSDGTGLFDLNAFAPGTQVNRATYQMLSTDAGLKYKGFSLDAEYFIRWVDDFSTRGAVPVDSLFDHGFQAQGSAMLLPKTLQAYVAGSYIFGEYGEPWDTSIGLNWYPFEIPGFRLNGQALYLEDSPVGYASVPFARGGRGWVYSLDVELLF